MSILDVTSMRPANDASRLAKIERLTRELRREIELGIAAGAIKPHTTFEFIVLRSDDTLVLRGRFELGPVTQQDRAA